MAVTTVIMLNYMFAFYSTAFFIFPKYVKVNTVLLIGTLLLVLTIYNIVDYLNFNFLLPWFGEQNYYANLPVSKIILENISTAGFSIIAAAAYYSNEKSLEKLQAQNEREKSLILRELNFLKNQFNSHITFNFLNYCYSNIHQTSPKTAEAIEVFSNLLRYSLEIRPDENVPLMKEVEYINNFIELQRLLTSQVNVSFICRGDLHDKKILSRLLITFVENAFKHGQINCPGNPISIELSGNEDSIELAVSNRKKNSKYVIKTGVGSENLLKVLELYYPDKFVLDIEDGVENYKCNLKLNVAL